MLLRITYFFERKDKMKKLFAAILAAAMFAVIAVLAMGAAVVFMKKRSY